MLRKKIIFTLIYENGFFNQSRNFRLQKVGNINWLERNYKFKDISFSLDELIVLNASKSKKEMQRFAQTLTKLVDDVFIPIAVGGGIKTIDDAKLLFKNGADKIVINTILYTNPNLVKELVSLFGSQSIIASIDYKIINNKVVIFVEDGTKELTINIDEYLSFIENELKVGEIYFNSIDRDGTGFGYDFETIDKLKNSIKLPIIIAGGAGNEKHLIDGLNRDGIDAVATANLFNFVGSGLPNARKKMIEEKLNIANWS